MLFPCNKRLRERSCSVRFRAMVRAIVRGSMTCSSLYICICVSSVQLPVYAIPMYTLTLNLCVLMYTHVYLCMLVYTYLCIHVYTCMLPCMFNACSAIMYTVHRWIDAVFVIGLKSYLAAWDGKLGGAWEWSYDYLIISHKLQCCFSIGFVLLDFVFGFRTYFWFSLVIVSWLLIIVSITKTLKPLTKAFSYIASCQWR